MNGTSGVQCRRCMDTGRICEAHPGPPWEGLYRGPEACACGAPGAECPACVDPAGPRGVPGAYRGMSYDETIEMLGGQVIATIADKPDQPAGGG